jgi:hypothetical protein
MRETMPETVPATRQRLLAVAGLFMVGAISFFLCIR